MLALQVFPEQPQGLCLDGGVVSVRRVMVAMSEKEKARVDAGLVAGCL